MKVSKTENWFKNSFQQPKTGLQKADFNIHSYRSEMYTV